MKQTWHGQASLGLASVILGTALVGCGGGGGGDAASQNPPVVPAAPSLNGVAAVGAPMAGATVTLTDATGRSTSTTAGPDGSYSFGDLTGFTAPFQIQATAMMGESEVTHHALVGSSADGAMVANVTPLTTAIAALAGPTDLPTALTPQQLAAIRPADLASAASQLSTVIAPLASKLGLAGSFDPLSTPFSANGQGADLLLDHLDVAVSTSGVAVSNKMAVAVDGQSTAAAGSAITKGNSSAPAPLAAVDTTDTQGFDALAQRFAACFDVPAGQRLTVAAGVGSLHSACTGLAAAGYLHNGTGFMPRWAAALNSAGFDRASFARPIVRLRVSTAPERIAVNLNFKDASGAGYTRPEIIERQADGSWLLVGNQRAFNGYAEAQANHVNDLTPNTSYNNLNTSRVDTGFRLAFDPRASFDSAGNTTYHGVDLAETTGFTNTAWSALRTALAAGSRMVGCVVVRGPGEKLGAKWSGIHPNGLLLKRPVGSTVQDYLAIDSVLSDGWRSAVDATTAAADGSRPAPANGAATNICGAGTTTSSSSSYVVDAAALGARKHALTGNIDDSIAGRDSAWNTGARYARMAPTGQVKSALEANPPLRFEVFDTDGRLRAAFDSRFLGRLPEVGLARAYVESQQVPVFSTDSLRRYLDFAAGGDSVTQSVTGTVDIDWTTPRGAYGADRIGLYSEIYRATPGVGVRGPLSRANDGSGQTSSLWTSDPELAATLDAMPGNNFYWWNTGLANPDTGTGGACSGGALVSTGGVNVARSVSRIGAESAYAGTLFGTQALASACLGAASHALLYREMFFRTYTDGNVRLYVTTANRQLRAPAP